MSLPSSVKTYEIVHRPKGLFFVCLKCGHEIAVNDFPASKVPKRTQAAAAMKAHQEQEKRAVRKIVETEGL